MGRRKRPASPAGAGGDEVEREHPPAGGGGSFFPMGGRERPASASAAGAGGEEVEPEDTTAGMGRRLKRRRPQSIGSGTAPVTTSQSRAATGTAPVTMSRSRAATSGTAEDFGAGGSFFPMGRRRRPASASPAGAGGEDVESEDFPVGGSFFPMGGRKRPASASPAGTGGEDVEPEDTTADMGRRLKRRRPESIEPGTALVTRSRSRAATSGTVEVVASLPRSTRQAYSARRPRSMPPSVAAPSSPGEAAAGDSIGSQLVTFEPATASTAGVEEWTAPASTSIGEELTAPASPARVLEPDAAAEDTAACDFVRNTPPLKMPYLEHQDSDGQVCEEESDPDSAVMEPYWTADREYYDKLAEIRKLPTLDSDTANSPDITQEREADTILKASEFVLGLSSYTDGELLEECSGILIKWSNGTGTILTTSKLICSNSPNVDEWLGGDEYALDAEVRVQLLHKDDFGKGKLMYLDQQYGFALFTVLVDEPRRLPRLCNERFGEDIILLGRYRLNLQIGNGKVLSKGAGSFQRHHYKYTDGRISSFGTGGAVINYEGDVTGMIASPIHFIPSSIILKCLEIFEIYSHVPRIHLGMKLLGIKCLNLVSKEKISRKYNVDVGLIVQEVSGNSEAEKLGVRMGDIILSVNGEDIATEVELENKLLVISKAHLEKGIVPGRPNADVTLVLGILNTNNGVRGRIQLRAKLSNETEIIKGGKHRVICRRPKRDVSS